MPKRRRRQKKKAKPDQRAQFVETARRASAGIDEETFKRALSQIAPRKTPLTNFGVWSAQKIREVLGLLSAIGARYEVYEEILEQHILEAWCAWDASAENPHMAYHLWIWSEDLPKVGTKIVDQFPERKFGAP